MKSAGRGPRQTDRQRERESRGEKLPKLSSPLVIVSSQKRWRLNEGGENYCQLEEREDRVVNRGLKKKTACGILHNFSDSIVKCETSPLSGLLDFSSLSAPLLHRGCGHIASRRRQRRESVFVGPGRDCVTSTSNPPWRDPDHQICTWQPEQIYGFS